MEKRDFFIEWVDRIGLTPLANKLGIKYYTILAWKTRQTSPRPEKAFDMIALSQGALRWEYIYVPFVKKLKAKKAKKAKRKK